MISGVCHESGVYAATGRLPRCTAPRTTTSIRTETMCHNTLGRCHRFEDTCGQNSAVWWVCKSWTAPITRAARDQVMSADRRAHRHRRCWRGPCFHRNRFYPGHTIISHPTRKYPGSVTSRDADGAFDEWYSTF